MERLQTDVADEGPGPSLPLLARCPVSELNSSLLNTTLKSSAAEPTVLSARRHHRPGVNTQLRDRSPTADLLKACSGGSLSRLNYKSTNLKKEAEVYQAPLENSDVPPLARFLLEGSRGGGEGVTSTLVGGETRPSAQQLAASHLLFRAERPFLHASPNVQPDLSEHYQPPALSFGNKSQSDF